MANEIVGLVNITTGAGIADADARYAPTAKGVTNGDSHDHTGGDGAAIVEAAITLADNTTNNVSATKHGFFPKLPSVSDGKTYAIKDGAVAEVTTSGGLSLWTELTSCYTATPASTSTLTMTVDKTGTVKVGMPIRYTISSVVYYGICTAITSNLLTIAGAPMGGDVTKLEYGLPSSVVVMSLDVADLYAETTGTTLLYSLMDIKRLWRQGKAYCVAFSGMQKTVASTTQAKVNLLVNSQRVSTADSGNGIQLSTAGTWVDNSAVAISTTYYDINPLEPIEIECTAAGVGTVKGVDLTIEATFVLE